MYEHGAHVHVCKRPKPLMDKRCTSNHLDFHEVPPVASPLCFHLSSGNNESPQCNCGQVSWSCGAYVNALQECGAESDLMGNYDDVLTLLVAGDNVPETVLFAYLP